MKNSQTKVETKDYEQLNTILLYLLAGLTGSTDGNEIISLTVQQADISAFRVVIRARGVDSAGGTLRVVAFTGASSPTAALLLAEKGYRENSIRWTADRFAKSSSDNGSSKTKEHGLSITD